MREHGATALKELLAVLRTGHDVLRRSLGKLSLVEGPEEQKIFQGNDASRSD